jgi:hypothetical protein
VRQVTLAQDVIAIEKSEGAATTTDNQLQGSLDCPDCSDMIQRYKGFKNIFKILTNYLSTALRLNAVYIRAVGTSMSIEHRLLPTKYFILYFHKLTGQKKTLKVAE